MSDTPPAARSGETAKFNPAVPHTARIWNYWLGGRDHFAADRAVGDQVRALLPDIVTSAKADRAFLAAQGVRVALQGHLPFYAAAKAVYDTLKHLRDGGAPSELKDRVASDELLRIALKQDDYTRRQSDYL